MEFEIVDGTPTFFAFDQVSDEAVQQCIDVFNCLSPNEGVMNSGIDKSKKDSFDVAIPPNDTLIIQSELNRMCEEYRAFFQLELFLPPLFVTEHINIQKYPYNGGYHVVHCEKGCSNVDRYRELVWMTYLNDVPAGGETYWPFYKKKIKPEKGRTVVWPAYFTHAHHGLPSMTTEKMIATGWFSTPSY